MSEWTTTDLAFQSDLGRGLVKPPFIGLIATVFLGLVSLASIFFSSEIGYVIAVFASLAGGFTSLQNQKRSGNSNYVLHPTFNLGLRLLRYAILAIALVHIARLAIAAANGIGMF